MNRPSASTPWPKLLFVVATAAPGATATWPTSRPTLKASPKTPRNCAASAIATRPGLQRTDVLFQSKRKRIAACHAIEGIERRQTLTLQMQDLIGLIHGFQHREAGAGADIGRNRPARTKLVELCGIEEAGAEEEVRCRAEHADRAGFGQNGNFTLAHMDAMAEQHALVVVRHRVRLPDRDECQPNGVSLGSIFVLQARS